MNTKTLLCLTYICLFATSSSVNAYYVQTNLQAGNNTQSSGLLEQSFIFNTITETHPTFENRASGRANLALGEIGASAQSVGTTSIAFAGMTDTIFLNTSMFTGNTIDIGWSYNIHGATSGSIRPTGSTTTSIGSFAFSLVDVNSGGATETFLLDEIFNGGRANNGSYFNSGTFTVSSNTTELEFNFNLNVIAASCGEGCVSSTNFSNTAGFNFTLPENVTFSSESGALLTAVPVPAAAWLFGSGLLGLIGVARRKP